MQNRQVLAIVIGAALAGFLGMRLFAAPSLQRQGPSLAALRSQLAQKDVEILKANAERDAALRLAIKNKVSAVKWQHNAVAAASTAKEQHNSKRVRVFSTMCCHYLISFSNGASISITQTVTSMSAACWLSVYTCDQ